MLLARSLERLVDEAFRPRPAWLLLTGSLVLGGLYALTMLPTSLIAGTGAFWQMPHGTIAGSQTDMVNYLIAYLYLAHSPWQLPLLFAPDLGAPTGTNAFWLDAVPWLLLTGKLIFTITGVLINPFGIYLFACLSLSGVALTGLLAMAGQRHLIAAIAGTALADTTPCLLFRWGHIPLLAQFWILVAFVLYLLWLRQPARYRIASAWLAVLCVTLLTNIYLFVMVAGISAAAVVQRRASGLITNGRLFAEVTLTIATLLGAMLVTGILSPDLSSVPSYGFGEFSMNLLSPFVPQMSGLIPPLSQFRVGMNSQYEGFAYLGAGTLIVTLASLPGWFAWARSRARAHFALIGVLFLFGLFALSNRIYLGSHLILQLPLPDRLLQLLGTFRSSGRFFWPVGYALAAGSLLLVLRRYRHTVSLVVLVTASMLQLVDAEPLRLAIAGTTREPLPLTVDRQRITALAVQSQGVLVFPSYGCVDDLRKKRIISLSQGDLLHQANIEIQFVTSNAKLPINSTYNTRLRTDCTAEEELQRQTLQRGILYVYLTDFTPEVTQLGGRSVGDVCSRVNWLHYCLIPASDR